MPAQTSVLSHPIAIVGVSALFPGSTDATGFWSDILQGKDLLTDVPSSHWRIEDYYDANPAAPDKTYAKRGGFLKAIDFDALGWGIPPQTLPATDTAQLLALVLAQSVLQDAARENFATMDRSRISVILGVTSAQELLFSMVSRLQRPVWVKALRESGIAETEVQAACDRIAAQYVPWQEASFPGLLGNVVAGRIANRLNLGGTNCVTDAACASTFSALSMAVNELQLGLSDLVIAGGVDTLNDIFMYMCFSKTPALSPSGDCRPFSDQADGTMLGEGLGMFALKRLADAERDGDRIYALLKGIGTSSDGRSKSVYAPVAAGQAQALRRAYASAGYSARTVELMEAHGTGTKAGDAAEFEGLRMVFGDAGADSTQWCALGSVKSQIGHTKAAAGAAGLFKAVMALHHKVLPPSIKIAAPNPSLAIAQSPFYLNTECRPWIRAGDHPRRASVSAFGFGGSNFHVTLEEYVATGGSAGQAAERLATQSADLVLIAAVSSAELRQRMRVLASATAPLAKLARDSRAAWDANSNKSYRLAIVASSTQELAQRLELTRARIDAAPEQGFELPDGSCYGIGHADSTDKVAMLFPGQGSQYLAMGGALAMQFTSARQVWDSAANLSMDGQTPLHQIVFPRPVFSPDDVAKQQAELTATEWAQPAIGAHSAALLAQLRALGLQADAYAGHSFGELMALHAAGVFGADSAIALARRRGELMRDASPDAAGAMTALNLPHAQVQMLIAQHNSEVVIANHNAPKQVVVSGALNAVADFEAKLSQANIEFRRLPVAAAFHSKLVASCCNDFAQSLAEVKMLIPTAPVFGNQSGALFGPDAQAISAQLAAQIAHPVRFVEMVEAMYEAGVRTFVEVGPGAVLTGLVSAILGARPHRAIALDRKGRDGVHTLLSGLARLAAAGIPFQAHQLFADTRAVITELSTGKLMVPINGANLGKPYPPKDDRDYPAPNLTPNLAHVIAPAPQSTPVSAPASTPIAALVPPTKPQPSASLIPSAARPPASGIHAMPATTVTAVSTPTSPVSDAWLSVFQATQAQTAAAQMSFQRTLAESHAAYLRLAETALLGLGGLRHNAVALPAANYAPSIVQHAAIVPAPIVQTPPLPAAPIVQAPPLIPAHAGIQANASVAAIPLGPGVRRDDGLKNTFDLPALLLSIVAEKTGYPVEMLALDMDLEGDLGIDSIKRVEILSSVDERAPHLPKVDRARLSALHTLAEIIAYLAPTASDTAPVIPAKAGIQANAGVTATPLDPGMRRDDEAFDLPALLLSVVAEKTGYPVEMLALDMDLEGDLGIDSIKRVEILSSVDERAPHLPKVDRARLSALHTLAEIIAYLSGTATVIPTQPVIPAHVGIQANAGVAAISRDDELACGDDDLLGRYTLELIPAPETGFAMPFLLDATPVYLIGHDELAAELAQTLRARGVNAHAVSELPDTAIACVYLGGMRADLGIDSAIAINFEAFQIARTLAAKLGDKGGLFVTVQDTGGDFGLGDAADLSNSAWLAGLPALIKTCALEWPRASVKAIDLAAVKRTSTELAAVIANELLQGGGELEVALKNGTRRTLVSIARAVQTGASVLAANDVVLVSGGARGVTSACLSEWAKREATAGRPLRFALLGRTALQGEPAACAGIDDPAQLKQILLAAAKAAGESLTPAALSQRVHAILAGREIQQSIASIRAHGAQARYCAVDVQNSAALKRLLDNVRESWGPIRALVHAAGVLSDKRIVDKTDAQFAHVFDTKVRGLQALLAATQNDPLRLLCVFSSVSARCGNTGQSDYAMANEVLAKVALLTARTRPELRVKSLGWGPWEAGMVTPQLKARFASLGVPMIPLVYGAQMFADEMNDVSSHAVELVLGGEPRAEALLFDGAESRIEALEVQVQRAGHAYLAGHAVNGEPVVPVVLVAEWLARAARSFRPGLTLIALHDLAVLKGIRLGGFEHDGDRFRIEARPAPAETRLSKGTSELQLLLLDCNGRPRYSARAELHTQAAVPGASAPKLNLEKWSGSPYPDQLFHRDQFELIEQVHGISDAGIAAQVRGVQDAKWPEQSWHFDVAALDGGMQLAVLYAQRMLGANNLPTAIASVRHYPAPPCAGPIVATAYPRSLSKAASTTDIYFVDGNGQRIAELLGVQNHALVA